jgi:hypothetical protein
MGPENSASPLAASAERRRKRRCPSDAWSAVAGRASRRGYSDGDEMRRLKAFWNFQHMAFAALVFGAEHVEGAMHAALRDGIRPTACPEVLQAAFQLKLCGKEECANRLLDAVLR